MVGRASIAVVVGLMWLMRSIEARADLVHESVSGSSIHQVSLVAKDGATREVDWNELSAPKTPGLYTVRFNVTAEAVLVPHCNGRERVLLDGVARPAPQRGPFVLPLADAAAHEITIEIKASAYEKRLACTEPPRSGVPVRSSDGVSLIRFISASPNKGGGEAVVFVPGGHDRARPGAVLVGTHPWNGSPWTYAAYKELIEEAGRRDVVLLMPSGLGNSLYVADAEEEVMRSIDALSVELAIDRQRVSIWGASMGGAGATTIGFHHPDRFAFIASYFGDSRYDLTTYVRTLLGGEEGARRVNALDVLENARHVPVLLVHGEDDKTSPMRQSTMLDDAMKKAGFVVELRRAPGMGHEGPLVVKHIRDVVARAASSVAPRRPARVTFRSVRPVDTEAYGVSIVRASPDRDAFVDVELRDDGVHVLAVEGASAIVLAKDALGATKVEPIKIDAARPVPVPVGWGP